MVYIFLDQQYKRGFAKASTGAQKEFAYKRDIAFIGMAQGYLCHFDENAVF